MRKSVERIVAEQVASKNGMSLVAVNYKAMQLVIAGLCGSRLEALEYLSNL